MSYRFWKLQCDVGAGAGVKAMARETTNKANQAESAIVIVVVLAVLWILACQAHANRHMRYLQVAYYYCSMEPDDCDVNE